MAHGTDTGSWCWSHKVKLLRARKSFLGQKVEAGDSSRMHAGQGICVCVVFLVFFFLYVRFKHMQNYGVGFISFAGGWMDEQVR